MGRKGKMIEHEIKSIYLNETMTLKLYQPESFSPLYKYNICIMQDGNDYYQMGRVATLSDKLHANQEITNTGLQGFIIRINLTVDKNTIRMANSKLHILSF